MHKDHDGIWLDFREEFPGQGTELGNWTVVAPRSHRFAAARRAQKGFARHLNLLSSPRILAVQMML